MSFDQYLAIPFFELDHDTIARTLSDSPELCRLSGKFRRLFGLQSPLAPSLAFIGGEVAPELAGANFTGEALASLSGNGVAISEALASCIGEGAELLSQFQRTGDVVLTGTLTDAGRRTTQCVQDWCRAHLGEIEPAAQPSLDWVSGVRLGDGAPVLLPADLCLRRLPHTQTLLPRSALSTGCAAGVSRETAMLRAVLELIERDAASLWWMGGRCPRPIALEEPAAQSGAALLSVLRAGRSARRSWLADVTTEFAVPCVAALSVDNDSRGLACGLAARMTLEEAVRAAILEMCQSELGLAVIEVKRRERGEAALNPVDRRHAARAEMLSAQDCELLHPKGTPLSSPPLKDLAAADALAGVVARLASAGIEVYGLDLTREDIGIPVVRAVAPGLQLFPSQLAGARLGQVIAETGGGDPHTKGISLL